MVKTYLTFSGDDGIEKITDFGVEFLFLVLFLASAPLIDNTEPLELNGILRNRMSGFLPVELLPLHKSDRFSGSFNSLT